MRGSCSILSSHSHNGNPLQCSCLENPRDGGAWWAAVYGVEQSLTRLKWLSSSSSSILTYTLAILYSLLFIKTYKCCSKLKSGLIVFLSNWNSLTIPVDAWLVPSGILGRSQSFQPCNIVVLIFYYRVKFYSLQVTFLQSVLFI